MCLRVTLPALLLFSAASSLAATPDRCPRPSTGGVVREPADLHSVNGVLDANLTIRNSKATDGSLRYCYFDAQGNEAPTLRVKPGDRVVILHGDDTHLARPG